MAGFCVSGFPAQQSNPIIPPPHFRFASSVVLGRFAAGNGSVTVPSGTDSNPFSGVSVGDVMVAFLTIPNNGSGGNIVPMSLVGFQPSGWSIVREDYNPGLGSTHGPMYAGIMTHVVTVGDALSYTFSRPVYNPSGSLGGIVASIVIAHNSNGIERTGTANYQAYPSGSPQLIAPSVQTIYQAELVFIAGMYAAGSGSIITSVNGLPDAKDTPRTPQTDAFYQFSTAGMSLAQPLTCQNQTPDPFTAYTVAMLPLL